MHNQSSPLHAFHISLAVGPIFHPLYFSLIFFYSVFAPHKYAQTYARVRTRTDAHAAGRFVTMLLEVFQARVHREKQH